MAGIYDLLPSGILKSLGFDANTNAMLGGMNESGSVPQMNQAAAILSQQQQQPEQGFLQNAQGILNNAGIKTDGFVGRLGNALLAAGSEDPSTAMLHLSKARNDQLQANKPKVTPLADGAFSLVSYPDGTTKIMKNEDVAKFLEDQQGLKFNQSLEKVKLGAQTQVDAANQKDVNKQTLEKAGGPQASVEFSKDVSSSIDKLNGVSQWLQKGGDSVPGLGNNPMVADAIDRTIGRATGNQNYEQRRYLDQFIGKGVLEAAQEMKGSLSDSDVRFLKGIQPKSDDPTELKIRYLNEFAARLKKNEEERVAAAKAVQEKAANPIGGGAAPAPTNAPAPKGITEDQVKAAGVAYDPNYEYAMVNGKLMRRKKGN